MNIYFLLILIISYFIGSIPFGFIIAKFKGIDIQSVGSKNIGATNVFRTLGPTYGLFVFLLDGLKGTTAVLIAQHFLSDPLLIILNAALVILGHMFPVFLKFKGGKGAATGVGALLGITPDIFFVALFLTIAITYFTRYVSLASITIPTICMILMFVWDKPLPYAITTGIVAIIMIIKHIPNIKRLLKGKELKIGEKS